MSKLGRTGSGGAASWLERPAAQYLLVAAVTALIMLVRLGATSLDEHETKAALAGRGMTRPDEWLLPGPDGSPPPANTTFNHWMLPTNNGQPRVVKTPLPYWCIAGVALATGGGVNEWTARSTSAVSAILCVLVALALGRRMLGPRAALLGAVMLATSVGMQKWGRNARPEMILCLFCTAAMACFYFGLYAPTRGRRAAWMIGFWAAMGLANLCKEFFPLLLALPLAVYVCWLSADRRERAGLTGETPWIVRAVNLLLSMRHGTAPPAKLAAVSQRTLLAGYWGYTLLAAAVGVVLVSTRAMGGVSRVGLDPTNAGMAATGLLVAGPVVWLAVRSRPWRDIGALLPTAVPGAVLMFAAFLPWMWYMKHLLPQAGAIFDEQVSQRAAGTGKWIAAEPHYYLMPLVTLTLPWLAFLPGGCAVAWMKRFGERRSALVYLFLWSAGLLLLLTLSAGKREHYILPMVPAICLLMGFVAEDVLFGHRWITPRLGRAIGIGYGAAAAGAVLVVGVALAVSSIGSEVIAGRLAAPGKPPRLLLSLQDSQPWAHMLAAAAIAAIPGLLGLWAAVRWKLAWSLALAAAWIVALYVGYYAGGAAWDQREPVARFARVAAEMVGDEPAVAATEQQAKVVFYFGRNIPESEGKPSAEWVFTYAHCCEDLIEMGYEVAWSVQGIQAKRLVFVLMRRGQSPVLRDPGT